MDISAKLSTVLRDTPPPPSTNPIISPRGHLPTLHSLARSHSSPLTESSFPTLPLSSEGRKRGEEEEEGGEREEGEGNERGREKVLVAPSWEFMGLPLGHCPYKLHSFSAKEMVKESVIFPNFDLQVFFWFFWGLFFCCFWILTGTPLLISKN